MQLDSRIPGGPLAEKWDRHRFELKLVNPTNKRKFDVIVVGTGLAGASASASLGELGYNVKTFCIQDTPRRAHSIAAQGGINAAKNYRGDGDSIRRLFYDTIKGGDFRAREANVYRLAQVSNQIIDLCVAQGVPFAREYGGAAGQPLLRRRPGGKNLLRPRPDRAAAAPRGLQRHDAPGAARKGEDLSPARDGRPGRGRRGRPRHRRPQPHHRGDGVPCGPRRPAGHRRLRQPLLPLHQRDRTAM